MNENTAPTEVGTTGQNIGQVQQQQVLPQQQTPQQQQTPVSDRTSEQFQKLLDSNRKLYEANEQLRKEMEARNNTPAPARQVQPNSQQQVDPRDFIDRDPITGEQFINEGKMRARIQEIEERASRAENRVNSFVQSAEKQEQMRQERETFSAYPELDPSNEKFDNVFHRQVRGVLYDSALFSSDYGGRPLSFKEAADLVKGQTSNLNKTAPATGANNPGEESAANPGASGKAQASAQVMSQPQNAPQQTSSEELELLRHRTRIGDDKALAARLVAVDHVKHD